MVPARPARAARQPVPRLLRVERHADSTRTRASSSATSSRRTGPGTPWPAQYYWHRFYSHQPDLNFDNPDVRRGDAARCRLLARDGRRRPAPRRRARTSSNGRARSCENLPETHEFLKELRAHVDERVPGPHAARRGEPVARGRGRVLRRRRRVPHGLPLPADAAPVHGVCAWKTASRSSTSCARRPRSPTTASGRCSCATTTSSRSRWSPTKSATTCTAPTPHEPADAHQPRHPPPARAAAAEQPPARSS